MSTVPSVPVPDEPPARATLRELLDAYYVHGGRLVEAWRGIGDPQTPAALAGHAIVALRCQHRLAAEVLYGRWLNARDALAHGAPIRDVAAAMGLDPVEVAVGLRSWADGQAEHCGMTDAERTAVLALVEGY